MMWQKYTLDEWLEQFGAWCNTCMDKGGRLPDGLHINQIYWLMQSVEPRRTKKSYPACEISDDEALAVNRLLCQVSEILPDEMMLVVMHKVHKDSLREVADITGKSYAYVQSLVKCGIYYLAGQKQIIPA